MIKIIRLFELLIVCGALLKARSCLFGLSLFYPFKKLIGRLQRDEKKDNPSSLWTASGRVKNLEHLIGGSILLSKGGSVQTSVKE
jgi:hypothetical protein